MSVLGIPLGLAAVGTAAGIVGNLLSGPPRPEEKAKESTFERELTLAQAPKKPISVWNPLQVPEAQLSMEQKQMLAEMMLSAQVTVTNALGLKVSGAPEQIEITSTGLNFKIDGETYSLDSVQQIVSAQGTFRR